MKPRLKIWKMRHTEPPLTIYTVKGTITAPNGVSVTMTSLTFPEPEKAWESYMATVGYYRRLWADNPTSGPTERLG